MNACNAQRTCFDCTNLGECGWCSSTDRCLGSVLDHEELINCSSATYQYYYCSEVENYWKEYEWIWWSLIGVLVFLMLCCICCVIAGSVRKKNKMKQQQKKQTAGIVENLGPASPRNGPRPIPIQEVRPVPISLPAQQHLPPQFVYGPPPVIVMQPNNYPQQQVPNQQVGNPPMGTYNPQQQMMQPMGYPPAPPNINIYAQQPQQPRDQSGMTVSYDPNAYSAVPPLSDRAGRPMSPRRADLTPAAIDHLKQELNEAQIRNNQLQDRVEWLAKTKKAEDQLF